MEPTDAAERTYRVRRSPYFVLLSVVVAQILFLAASILATVLLYYLQTITGYGITPVLVVTILLFANVAITIFIFIDWIRSEHIIRPDVVIIRKGLLGLREDIYKHGDIEAVHVVQSPIGRLLNYGTVQLHYKNLNEEVLMTNIPDPLRYERIIEERSK